MLENNSLLYFKNYEMFNSFYKKNIEPLNWSIKAGFMNERGEEIRGSSIHTFFVQKFREMTFFRRDVSIAEVVSFIDTMVLTQRVFEILKGELIHEVLDLIEVVFEYKIQFSKNRRVDCILKSQKRLLILEFRLSSSFNYLSTTWSKKQMELLVYKELMNNYLQGDFKMFLFAFIGLPEYDKTVPLYKHIKYNNDNINFLASYVCQYLIKQ